MNAKSIGIAIFVILAIGAKVAFATPKYRTMTKETVDVPQGQAFIQQVHVRRDLKARLNLTADHPVSCFWLSPSDHAMIQSGEITDPTIVERMTSQHLVNAVTTVPAHEFHLKTGEYFIYFEPETGEEPDPKIVTKITFEVAEWR